MIHSGPLRLWLFPPDSPNLAAPISDGPQRRLEDDMSTSSPPRPGGVILSAPRPLTCRKKSGEPYRRHEGVEAEISAALTVGPIAWLGPDGRPKAKWRLETLVHLVRSRVAAGDDRVVGALMAEFLSRAKPIVDSRAQGYGLADTEEIEIEVSDGVVDLIMAQAPTRMSEYLEVDAYSVLRQRTDRAVLKRRDLPKARDFRAAQPDDEVGWSPVVENLPDGGLDPLAHLLEAEDASGGGRVRSLLRAVKDPRHRKAFILHKLRGWPYTSPDPNTPTLCSHFAPIGERQIRNWINTAIAQMRGAHGDEA